MSSFARPTANRAVHLRITPRPSNLGESREIWRLISQFGEVEYFKNLKYDTLSAPNAALVIYKEEKAARECLRRSPIRFRMGRVGGRQLQQKVEGESEVVGETGVNAVKRASRGPIDTPFGLPPSPNHQTRTLSTSALPTPPPNPIRMPFDPFLDDNNNNNNDYPDTANNNASETRLFQIQTNPSFRNFRDQINASHYHGPFALDSTMPGQQDLAKKVPLVGLSCVDWRKGEVPWRIVQRGRQRENGWLRELGLGRRDNGRRSSSENGDVDGRFHGSRSVKDDGGRGEEEVEKAEVKVVESVVTKEKEKGKDTESEEDALSRAMKGWEQFFPGISSGGADSVERYSRKRK